MVGAGNRRAGGPVSAPNDGGPAFPVQGSPKYGDRNGMSLRDWFAGQALAGILAAAERTGVADGRYPDKEIAKVAVMFGDATLAELEK